MPIDLFPHSQNQGANVPKSSSFSPTETAQQTSWSAAGSQTAAEFRPSYESLQPLNLFSQTSLGGSSDKIGQERSTIGEERSSSLSFLESCPARSQSSVVTSASLAQGTYSVSSTPERPKGRPILGSGVLPDHSTPMRAPNTQLTNEQLIQAITSGASAIPMSPVLPPKVCDSGLGSLGMHQSFMDPSVAGETSGARASEVNDYPTSPGFNVNQLQELMGKMMIGSPQQRPFINPYDPMALAAATAMQQMYNPLAGNPYLMDPLLVEHYSRMYRNASMMAEPVCTWSGQLPPRDYKNPTFSCKIFVGGVPWDITEGALLTAFRPFGPVRVEWPGKEARYARSPVKPAPRGKVTGYVYMIFENEQSVHQLLQNCSQEFGTGGDWYFKLTARRTRTKEIRQVQVIPWIIADSSCVRSSSQKLDPKKTVFVGALHGMVTAEILANIMNDLFGNVVYAGIDTDKHKYPIGSGRVTFSNTRSYFKAIQAAFVEIKTVKFDKKVQIDPFLEDSVCTACQRVPGPYFCREMMCFRYFCRNCWQSHHQLEIFRSHKPLMRSARRNQPLDSTGASPSASLGSPSPHPSPLSAAGYHPDPFM